MFLVWIACGVAIAYQLFAIFACLRYRSRRFALSRATPPVSILKPVYGRDEAFWEAIRSHAELDYPSYEVLFGVRSMSDPAVEDIQRLIREHPQRDIRLILVTTRPPNGKAGALIDMEREARYPIIVMNDSDIKVEPDYLLRIAAPLEDPGCGIVTCPYRAAASSVAGKWESVGIGTDFIPSTLVAPLVGVKEYGLGSTLCFRREDLHAIGGFEAVGDYIADDYQLAKRITGLGKRAELSVTVETHLGAPSWAAVWKHQLRWARTIRTSRPDGYAGLPVTHAGLWALLALATGLWPLAAVTAIVRMFTGVAAGAGVAAAVLAPLWDLWAFVVWINAWLSRDVEWRGEKIQLTPDGRMVRAVSR